MSLERLTQEVDRKTDRVQFLKRAALVTLATAAGALGLAPKAKALYDYACCHLCQPPSSCSGQCDWWSWPCCDWNTYPVQKWTCMECYRPWAPDDCGPACSQANQIGTCATL